MQKCTQCNAKYAENHEKVTPHQNIFKNSWELILKFRRIFKIPINKFNTIIRCKLIFYLSKNNSKFSSIRPYIKIYQNSRRGEYILRNKVYGILRTTLLKSSRLALYLKSEGSRLGFRKPLHPL